MCAGITMYDPMLQHGIKSGDRVGIVGLGGLGVMGVKLAKALGCTVSVISRSKAKEALALKVGADKLVASSIPEDMEANVGSLDLIINTVPTFHDYSIYKCLLDRSSRIGKQVLLGLHEGIVSGFALPAITFGRSRIAASGIGGIEATQQVIDLCAKHKIYPELEIVGVSKLNKVYQQLNDSNDSGKRYVLDLATLKEGVVCDDPAPKLDDVKGMSVVSSIETVFSDLLSLRWW